MYLSINQNSNTMMEYIWTGIIGLLAGALAKFLLPGKDPGGFFVTMLIGIGGSFVGKYVAEALNIGFLTGFIGSVLGAIAILLVWRLISTKLLNNSN